MLPLRKTRLAHLTKWLEVESICSIFLGAFLSRLEEALAKYFNNDDLLAKGLPTVQFIAETLNISPNYLSDVLKVLTGQSTQQHIHNKLIEKAKEKLSGTDLSISEYQYKQTCRTTGK